MQPIALIYNKIQMDCQKWHIGSVKFLSVKLFFSFKNETCGKNTLDVVQISWQEQRVLVGSVWGQGLAKMNQEVTEELVVGLGERVDMQEGQNLMPTSPFFTAKSIFWVLNEVWACIFENLKTLFYYYELLLLQ